MQHLVYSSDETRCHGRWRRVARLRMIDLHGRRKTTMLAAGLPRLSSSGDQEPPSSLRRSGSSNGRV